MVERLTRTVTFLFTDIEGSTRLWQDHPEAMTVALARHDQILKETIESNGGYVFKTVGDAFCAVFQDAARAALSAISIHQLLNTEDWPQNTPIRVRAALYTGTAELRNDDYFGVTLSRVARLLAVGHGGQTLVSKTTRDLLLDSLPAGASVVSKGEHRLRDLSRPEEVYQLNHPDLQSDFPALLTVDSLPNNLTRQF